MTATLNRVQLIGNLGADPKSYTTKEGSIFVTATLATDEAVKRNGEWETIIEWHQLIFFGSMTKITEHLHRGSQIFVAGRLRTNNRTDANGINHRATSIVVSNVQLLGHAKFKQEQASEPASKSAETHLAQVHDMLVENSEAVPF
jgi:single-strand DNA-binding protein